MRWAPRIPEGGELMWVAGLLEGEGSFGMQVNRRTGHLATYRSPRIQCQMSDKDVIERLAGLVGGHVSLHRRPDPLKDMWAWGLSGNSALILMAALAPHMGERRKSRISEVLLAFPPDYHLAARQKVTDELLAEARRELAAASDKEAVAEKYGELFRTNAQYTQDLLRGRIRPHLQPLQLSLFNSGVAP